ncbi:1,4-dihydroxy-2-naphthoate prenyltransferase [Nonlabens sp. Hel1_33_55]|uniref:1,4-dihydroxy-2-naphthoate octaprenyltransferase n=1 Tax=Nonlabens sp. Hel1_33_55 TaxID=1336802 RepID=UPI000875BD3B|nr:1,4-dihydroxy-2-naphthoate octaprenyltransferase [Nonlabens sp. Hel1_33_55]SCX95193.1 1,4-dihydroxy-2-naphthoate prenyltransferase [Nonlabens sp. Hel1_33_55]
MKNKTQAWISAARPRTLPLSISGILVGSAYAYLDIAFAKAELESAFGENVINIPVSSLYNALFNWWIPVLALLTTLGFQILSNFANDYGDGVKGTDNHERIGPMRAIQSGIIQPAEMKRVIIITSILTFMCAIALIYVSLGLEQLVDSLLFLGLGIAAIWAAIKYTVGDNAYGYRGLGDVFVFIFFGPVSVIGIYYLITSILSWQLILPSISIGLLSVTVLNLNNMRDIKSDLKAGKNTIPVKLGLAKSKKLHYTYIISALVAMTLFLLIQFTEAANLGISFQWILFLPVLAFIPLIAHLFTVKKTASSVLLDPELKKVALSTFLLALLSVISVLVIS